MKRSWILTISICIWLAIIYLPFFAIAAVSDDIHLTQEERAWLDSHRKIVVGGETDWAPFDFVDEIGNYSGLSNEYLGVIEEMLGIEIEMVIRPSWNELLTMAKQRKIDVLPAIYHSKEREEFLNFSQPYLTLTEFIIARTEDSAISDLADLKDKTIVVVKGYTIESLLRSQYPDYRVVTAPTIQESLKMIVTGDADAFVGDIITTAYNIKQLSLVGIRAVAPVPFEAPTVHMAVRKDWPILATLIDKVFNTMPQEEKSRIKGHWLGVVEKKIEEKSTSVHLTPAESDWVAKHPVIRVHNEEMSPPFNFNELGRPKGFSIDYMKLLAGKIGLQVEFVTGPSWDEFLEMMKDGSLDLMLNIARTPEREKFLSFTPPYTTLVQTLYTRTDVPPVESIKDLYGKKVAIPKGFYIIELLKPYPGVEVVEVRNVTEAMQLVSVGKADALYDLMPVVNYLMGKLQITNLKVGGQLGIEAGRPMPLHLAVPKREEILVEILSKGMASISDEEYQAVVNKWLDIPFAQSNALDLTLQEKAWIMEHPEISVNGGEWPPFIMKKGNVNEGISVDIIKHVADLTGLKVKFVDGPWPVMMEMLKKGELDIAQCISKTPERNKYLLFTTPYLSPQDVVFVRVDNENISTIVDLDGKVVAVEESTHLHELLKKDYPKVKLSPVSSALEGLRGVSSGNVDAYIGTQIVAQYTAQKHLVRDVKIVADLATKANDLRFGSRKENYILIGLLQKALAAVDESEINKITDSYVQPIRAEIQTVVQHEKLEGVVSYKSLLVIAAIVFAILILVAIILLRVMKSEQVAASFGSGRFRLLTLVGLTVFVVVVGLSGWLVLEDIKKKILADIATTLKLRVKAASDSLDIWVGERKSLARSIGQDPELLRITERLLEVERNAEALQSSSALAEVRAFFKNSPDVFPNIGFFIINPDNMSVASMRDNNIGTKNLISIQRPDIIRRAFAGEVLFVPPIQSDVALGAVTGIEKAKMLPTMFLISPIRAQDGEIIAVMTLRVDPTKGITRIMKLGVETELSYEAYVFNKEGILLSESRFDHQLREIGLLGSDSSSAMNITLSDPGVNLLESRSSLAERGGLPFTELVDSAIKLRLKNREGILGAGQSPIETNVEGYSDYRGVTVYGAWLWNSNLDLGVAAEIDAAEVYNSYSFIRTTLFWILGFTLVLSVGAVLLVLAVGERTRKVMDRARVELEKKVEERTAQLRESEEHSRLILSSIDEGLFEVDTEGVTTYINPKALEILGFSEEDILGTHVHDLIHHTHADGTEYDVRDCSMSKAFTEGTSHHVMDEVLWRKDGSSFDVEYLATPLVSGRGVVGAVVTFQDISERRKAEQSLLKREQQLRTVFESSPGGVVHFNSAGEVIDCNDTAIELIGTTRENLMSFTVQHFQNEEVKKALLDALQGDFSVYEGEYVPVTGTNKGGLVLRFLFNPVSPGLLQSEVICFFEDVSVRKQIEDSLALERDQFQQMMDTSPIGIAISVKGVFRFVNDTMIRQTGLEPNDDARKFYVHPEDRDHVIESLQRFGKLENYEAEVPNIDGNPMHMLVSFYVFTYQGEQSVLGWAVDISDLKQIENELRDKFEDLDRFQKLAVGRESRMIELKKEINKLLDQAGESDRYKIH